MTFSLGKQIHGTAHVGVMDYIYVLFRDKERSTGLSVEAIGNIARKGCCVHANKDGAAMWASNNEGHTDDNHCENF